MSDTHDPHSQNRGVLRIVGQNAPQALVEKFVAPACFAEARMTISEIGAVRVLEIAAHGSEIGSESSAIDLIGDTYGQEIDLIAIPVSRLSPEFLTLRTGMAGHFLQKFINYGYRVALIGDISAATLASQALRDFVFESNRGRRVLFAPNRDALVELI